MLLFHPARRRALWVNASGGNRIAKPPSVDVKSTAGAVTPLSQCLDLWLADEPGEYHRVWRQPSRSPGCVVLTVAIERPAATQ